jgi:ubiquinone/menaquinone biosynthesis C-methylase UbiE
MAAYLKFRERFRKPELFVQNIGVSEGNRVLDYGCGIGSYSIPLAKAVGNSGRVYALDIHPIAVERVRKRAKKDGLTNIETIQSDLATGIPDEDLDYALLIDVWTWVHDKKGLLQEMHRIMKPNAKLIILIDHAPPEDAKKIVDESNLFSFVRQEDNVLHYEKE